MTGNDNASSPDFLKERNSQILIRLSRSLRDVGVVAAYKQLEKCVFASGFAVKTLRVD